MLNCGRRWGKTHLSIVELLRGSIEKPGGTFFYCAPTYRAAKDIAWLKARELIPPRWIRKKHEGDLKITLINGSTIELKGTENADTLRGRSLTGAVIDEAAYVQEAVWEAVLRPALSDQRGWALFISTPPLNGTQGWYFDLYERLTMPDVADESMVQINMNDWSYWSFTTLEGGNVSPDEIAQAKREMDPRTFRVEYEASFEALSGLVASQFSVDNISKDAVDDGDGVVLVGVDFNVDPLTAVFGVIRDGKLLIFDEMSLEDSNTWDFAEAVGLKFGIDRRIEIMPDPTGARRQTSGVGASDHAILRRAGMKVIAPKAPWNIRDKINAVNAALRTADGEIHTLIHPRCRNLIKSFRTLGYAPGTDIPDKKQFDHPFDAFGYLVLSRFNLVKPRVSGITDFALY
jgi:hypothetical protein